LPLAIRLVAAQLASHHAWSASALAADLAVGVGKLAMMQADDVSVSAAFDLSYERLPSQLRQLFLRLGLQPGPDVDANAAAALMDVDAGTAGRYLDQLYDWHLIDEPVRGRYRFHDLIREHAIILAGTGPHADNDAAINRLLMYYRYAAASADRSFREKNVTVSVRSAAAPPSRSMNLHVPEFPSYADALAWLELERLNLMAVVGYAAGHGDYQTAADISHSMAYFAEHQGYWDQILASQRLALDCAGVCGDRPARARMLNDMAALQLQRGGFADARAGLEQALLLYRELGDQPGEAEALMNTGVMHDLTGDPRAGIPCAETALSLYRRLGDQYGQAAALDALCMLNAECANHKAAVEAGKEALKIFAALGVRIGQAMALNDLGLAQERLEDADAAVVSLERALRLFRDLDNPRGEATVLNNLGNIALERGDFVAARSYLERALGIFQKLGSPLGTSKVLGNLGQLDYQVKDYESATRHLNMALRIYQDLGDLAAQRYMAHLLSEIESADHASEDALQ
jgi:tetratricopeptide (TPR) repeat protein